MLIVKVGGSEGINYDAFLKDFIHYKNTILIHGGSHELNKVSTKLGHPPKILTSISGFTSRYTDRKTMDIFNMVYGGKMNKMIVEKLHALGQNAIGLSGLDGRLFEGSRKKAIRVIKDGKKRIIRDDMTGKVEQVNIDLITLLMDNGYTLVITPPAISNENIAINVDGDRLSAVVASAMNADKLVILSNVPGLLRDTENYNTLIEKISRNEVEHYMDQFAKGRMKKKLLGAKEALDGGVSKVILGDCRNKNPLTSALNGQGTVIE
mgnify:CR=1 FL=1|tara:strand:- start:1420 stop:2214 length:795 start_codon:yes stop_codon:yes gene_type:complete